MEHLRDEFLDFAVKVSKGWGIDNLSATLLGFLYLEPAEVSLDKLATETGYSLASVSNKLRVLDAMGLVERRKKPGSKKVYYYAEKDLLKLMERKFRKTLEVEVLPAKKVLPGLIAKYENKKLTEEDLKRLDAVKKYYKQILETEELLEHIRFCVREKRE